LTSAQRVCIGRVPGRGPSRSEPSRVRNGRPEHRGDSRREVISPRTDILPRGPICEQCARRPPPNGVNDSFRPRPSCDIRTLQLLTRRSDESLNHFAHTGPDRTQPPKRPDSRRVHVGAEHLGDSSSSLTSRNHMRFPNAEPGNQESHTRQALYDKPSFTASQVTLTSAVVITRTIRKRKQRLVRL
jgi:hypothetical protein